MSRWKAAFYHLLISAVVVGCVAAVMIGLWYPPALTRMANADKLLMLIGGIDLIAGPLLTLIVFKHDKPEIKTDLAVIALLQTAFLAYGAYTLTLSRPVFLVASIDRFDLVFANEINADSLTRGSAPEFRSLGFTGPRLVGAVMPQDPKKHEELMMSGLAGKGDLQDMPEYFVPYANVAAQILGSANPLAHSRKWKDAEIDKLVAAARDLGRDPDSVRWTPIASTRGFAAMLIDAKTGAVLGPVRADP